MDEQRLEVLSARLDRLERENRRMRRAGGVLLAGLAALVLTGQALPAGAPRVVEAELFVLRDSGGSTRAVLHTQADGSPSLDFRDAAGRPRASLGVQGDAAHFGLTGTSGKGGTFLRTQANGRPSLILADANGTRRATLFLSDDGSATLAFSDRQRASRVVLNALENGPLGLWLYDADGRLRTLLDLEPDGSPALALFDESRRGRAILGHTELEGDQPGTVEKRDASSLLLFDRTGTVIWRAP